MMGGYARYPGPRREYRGRPRGVVRRHGYPLGQFILYYLLALLTVGISFAISPGLGIVAYPVAGYILNRLILRDMYWQKYITTLADVARVKVAMLVLWPLTYLRLLAQIALAQLL